jgi:single-strand DNA-binding protein
MNNLNSVLIEGNLVRDPMCKTTPKGTPICTFTVASSRFFKGDYGIEKEVSYFDVETFGKLAESCRDKGRKGRGVRVVGRLRQDRWNDSNGKQQSRVVVAAEHVEFRPEFIHIGDQNELFDDETLK